jgi:hypothetical protein
VRRLAVVFVASGLAILLARDGLHIPCSTHSFATADRAVLALAADLDRSGRRLRLSEAQQSAWEAFTAAKAELILAEYEMSEAQAGRGPAAVWLPDWRGGREALFSRHAAALKAFRASAERLQAMLTAEQRRLAGNLLEGPQPWMFPLPLSPVARL